MLLTYEHFYYITVKIMINLLIVWTFALKYYIFKKDGLFHKNFCSDITAEWRLQ